LRNLVSVLLLAVCAFATACSSGGSNSNSCANCGGCSQAGVCQPGAADSACGSAGGACAVCSGGQTCQSGTCRAPALLIGGKCTTNGDCGTGICAPDVPGGGYCTQDCSSLSCPTGSRCINAGSFKLCLESCGVSSDCRSEHLCFNYTGGNLCLPKCTQDSDCDSSNCDAATGICGPSRVGNSCGTSADCGQVPAFCDTSAAGGYCSLPCSAQSCPSGSTCIVFSNGSNDCLNDCATASDCRPGYLCAQLVGGGAVCVPGCQADTDCSTGQVCDKSSGKCVAAPSGSGTTVDVVDLTSAGAVTVYTNHLSAPLSTTLPTDAVSVTFVGQGPSGRLARR